MVFRVRFVVLFFLAASSPSHWDKSTSDSWTSRGLRATVSLLQLKNNNKKLQHVIWNTGAHGNQRQMSDKILQSFKKRQQTSEAPLPLTLIAAAFSNCRSLTVGVSLMLTLPKINGKHAHAGSKHTWYLLSSRNGMPRYRSEKADAVQTRRETFLTEPPAHSCR